MASSKYARVEIERRFLLAGVPADADVLAVNEIDDRYLGGTRLRLRRMAQVGGPTQLKLTQKAATRTPTGVGARGSSRRCTCPRPSTPRSRACRRPR